jgi:Tol biopolymer transport system component
VVELASGELTPFRFEESYSLRSHNLAYGRARWMPDGSAIAYLGLDRQGRTGLWVQDFSTEHDTFETRRALIGFDGSGVHESFGISPDGKRIMVSTVEQMRAIHLVEGLPGS